MPAKSHYRVVILGSGPAGLTAAVYASRAELAPLVVEGGGGDDATDVPGGQLMLTTDVDNYPGFPEGVLGPELMERMRQQAARFGTEFTDGELKKIVLQERPFKLSLAGAEITADTVIVATGARAKWLGLPEELEFRTKIGGVSACATCDGFFYKQQARAGRGRRRHRDGGSHLPHEVRRQGHDRAPPPGAARQQGDADARPPEPEDRVAASTASSTRSSAGPARASPARPSATSRPAKSSEVACGGIFMAIGHTPNTAVFEGQLEKDEQGYLLVHDGTTRHERAGCLRRGRRHRSPLPPGDHGRGHRLHGRDRRGALPEPFLSQGGALVPRPLRDGVRGEAARPAHVARHAVRGGSAART